MRLVAILLFASACAGCGIATQERQALADDGERFIAKAGPEYQALKTDFDDYVAAQKLSAKAFAIDTERFLEWRRREWWHLRDEFAATFTENREAFHRLLDDVARFYGYEVRNLPKLGKDWLEFFRRADPEWQALCMDIAIFLEWHGREWMPLRRDIKMFYEGAGWEAANFAADMRGFLSWREREYNKLIRDGKDWFAASALEWDGLRQDIERQRAHAVISGQLLVADFAAFWHTETQIVCPRLWDDVSRFSEWREREWHKLKASVKISIENAGKEGEQLIDDVRRHIALDRVRMQQFMIELEGFFDVYEREIGPLAEDVRRFWRVSVATGHLALSDAKRFFTSSATEVELLRADMGSFFAYGSEEWARLTKRVKNFIDPDLGLHTPMLPVATPRAGVGNDPIPADEVFTR